MVLQYPNTKHTKLCLEPGGANVTFEYCCELCVNMRSYIHFNHIQSIQKHMLASAVRNVSDVCCNAKFVVINEFIFPKLEKNILNMS